MKKKYNLVINEWLSKLLEMHWYQYTGSLKCESPANSFHVIHYPIHGAAYN